MIRKRENTAHVVGRPSEVDQLRLFIRNLQLTYKQHLKFTPFDNFASLKKGGMLIEEELLKKTIAKIGSNLESNHQNKDKKGQ